MTDGTDSDRQIPPADPEPSPAGAAKAADFAQQVRVGHHQAKVERLCAQLDDVKRQALALVEVVQGRADAIVAAADRAKAELTSELEAMKGRG